MAPVDEPVACLLRSQPPSRRTFLKVSCGGAGAFAVLAALGRPAGSAPYTILERADGLIVADPVLCTGCKRCELACTEYNDGRAQPSLARLKVSRNHNFGPRGQQAGIGRGMGQFGNFRVVVDTCLQCPHPVPCSTACAAAAIVVDVTTRARVVDRSRCTGCRFCERACPWEMIAFDRETSKATKCTLCEGKPECVEACPTSALRYVAWRDLTTAVPARQAAMLVDTRAAGCSGCHKGR